MEHPLPGNNGQKYKALVTYSLCDTNSIEKSDAEAITLLRIAITLMHLIQFGDNVENIRNVFFCPEICRNNVWHNEVMLRSQPTRVCCIDVYSRAC